MSQTYFCFDWFFFKPAKQFLSNYTILLCGTGHKDACNEYTGACIACTRVGGVPGESTNICSMLNYNSKSPKADEVTKGHQECQVD